VFAGPNPITDDENDESQEKKKIYNYPDFEKESHPYWNAFPKETQYHLKEHDRLELQVLGLVRTLDFKLREAWTVTDKPFLASQ